MSKKLAGTYHAHGCRRCHVRYQDACHTPEDDPLCAGCRGLKPGQVLIDSAAPHACCKASSRLVITAEKAIYRLAGGHLWFICKTCARTHPFDPRRTP